jgi:putative transposase
MKTENVSKIMQSFKKYTAKEIISQLQINKKFSILKEFRDIKPDYKIKSIHQIWQRDFIRKAIQTLEMLKQKSKYIHNNPVRKNLVKNPEDWKYSPAIDYLTGKKGLLEIVRMV